MNGDVIRLGELQEGLAIWAQENKQDVASADSEQIARKILASLIDQRVQLQEADREKIVAEDAEVNEQMTDRVRKLGFKTIADLERAAREQGVSMDALKKRVRDQIRVNKIVRRKVSLRVSVTPQEVDDFVNKHRGKPGALETPQGERVQRLRQQVEGILQRQKFEARMEAWLKEIKQRSVIEIRYPELAQVALPPPAPAPPAYAQPVDSEKLARPLQRSDIEGEPVPFDTKDPRYHDYFAQIRKKIQAMWAFPCVKIGEACEHKTTDLDVEFGIAKDGQLVFVNLRRSSPWPIYDDYALNAIWLAAPFPPVPPPLLQGNGLPIVARFNYIRELSIRNILR